LTWPTTVPYGTLVVVWMTSMNSTVQNAVYNVDYGHLKSLDLQRSLKLFIFRGPGIGIQVLGLAIDN